MYVSKLLTEVKLSQGKKAKWSLIKNSPNESLHTRLPIHSVPLRGAQQRRSQYIFRHQLVNCLMNHFWNSLYPKSHNLYVIYLVGERVYDLFFKVTRALAWHLSRTGSVAFSSYNMNQTLTLWSPWILPNIITAIQSYFATAWNRLEGTQLLNAYCSPFVHHSQLLQSIKQYRWGIFSYWNAIWQKGKGRTTFHPLLKYHSASC